MVMCRNEDMVDFPTVTMIFQMFLLTSCIYHSDSQTLSLCADKNDGDPCLLSCHTTDVNQVISISKSPSYTALGTCLVGGSCFSADGTRYNVSQTGLNTNFEIFSFEKSDNATWRCEYTGNPPDDVFLSWSKLPASISELSVINSNVTITDELIVSVEVGCLYSLQDPKPKLQLMCDGAFVTAYDMSFSPSTTVCSDTDLTAYICNYTLTSTPPSQLCNSDYTGYSLRVIASLPGTTKTYEKDIFPSFSVSFKSLTVSTPEKTSTTIVVGQMTSSHNPSDTPYSETTGTVIGTTADYGLTSTSWRVTSEVTTPIKADKGVGSHKPSDTPYSETTGKIKGTSTDYGLTSTSWRVTSEVTKPIIADKIVGTIIAVAIPVGIFLLMIAIMVFIIICLRRSKRIRTKKAPNEPRRHKKMVTRKPNSSENIFYVNERNSPTLTQEFHRNKRFKNQEQFNSFNYPLSYHKPCSSHLNTYDNYRRGPDIAYGQSVLYRSLGYTIYQGNVPNQNGRSRRHYYH